MLCMLSAVSCVNDEYAGGQTEQTEHVTVNLNFKARNVPVETDATKPENQLKSIRVYIFDNDDDNPQLLGYHHATIDNDAVTCNFPIQLSLKRNQEGSTCRFYIIANEEQAKGLYLPDNTSGTFTFPEAERSETDGTWAFKDSTHITPEQLKSLRFNTLPQYGGQLPMALEEAKTVSHNQQFDFTLIRSVAKLSLYFAKYGAGQAYMGRGMYLYNIPEYGFLFPNGELSYIETNYEEDENGNNTDSYNQNGGKVILKAGAKTEEDENNSSKIDINEIEKDVSKLGGGAGNHANYDLIPTEPVYLYAHPQGKDPGDDVLDENEKTDGYMLKVLVHLHETDEDGDPDHKGEIYKVYLPKVQANHAIEVYSVFRMKSYVEIPDLHWMILPWNDKGGDIVFE